MNRSDIIEELEHLAQEPGYIYSLAFIVRHDLFLNAEQAADVNWRERLSFQELSFVLGLLVKRDIDLAVFSTQSD